MKDLKIHKIPKKNVLNTTVAVKKIRTKTLIQNYYVKQNILTKMIELILNQRMTKFQLLVNERVKYTADQIVNNSRFRCHEKLLTLKKASLISIYNTTIWTKRNFTWTSSSIKPNDNYEAKNNNMLWSEYEKVSTDLKRSVQTALPISSSWNIRLAKRTNNSKHGKK